MCDIFKVTVVFMFKSQKEVSNFLKNKYQRSLKDPEDQQPELTHSMSLLFLWKTGYFLLKYKTLEINVNIYLYTTTGNNTFNVGSCYTHWARWYVIYSYRLQLD